MFFSKKLKSIKNLRHCFFSRENGFSSGIYKGLNCGLGSGDKKENILKNLEFVEKKIGCKNNSLVTLNQRHTNEVIYFDDPLSVKKKLTGDAIVSKVKNIAIGVLTADCVPILFYDHKKKIIGCAHAGWKGALNGIIQNTISKFKDLKCNSTDLIAVVGPCIKKENYEVKNDLYEKFIEKNKKNKIFFQNIDKNKYLFDLRGFVNNEILNLNIKNLENIEIDTFSKKELFYSYRRACFNKEKDYGRCISVILMT